MVAAAFSTSTGLSGGSVGEPHVPLQESESEHDRTQGIAKKVEATAMETNSVVVISPHTHDSHTRIDSSDE